MGFPEIIRSTECCDGPPNVDEGARAQKSYRESRFRRLKASAAELGYELVLKPTNA